MCATSIRVTGMRRSWPSGRVRTRRPAGRSGSQATARCGRRRALVKRTLELAESLVPSEPYYELFIKSHAPDVILITPLIDFGSYQTDYVKSAHRLGIPIAFLPFSWDNLTNRGLVRIAPDRVLVWNEHQKREAVTYHDVPPDRVIVTGAPRFDDFFAMRPSTTRDAFAARAGLDASQPFLLYLCSSHFVAPDEVAFVRRWARAVRGHPAIGHCGILVRPHPANAEPWEGVDLGEIPACRSLERAAEGPGRSCALRFALPLRGRRRPEHQRHDRGRHSRQGGPHDRDVRVRRRAGADPALPLPAGAERGTGGGRQGSRRALRPAGAVACGSVRRRKRAAAVSSSRSCARAAWIDRWRQSWSRKSSAWRRSGNNRNARRCGIGQRDGRCLPPSGGVT